MGQNPLHSSGASDDPLLIEVERQRALENTDFIHRLPDADLMRMLAEARQTVLAMSLCSQDIPVACRDADQGLVTVPVPRDLVLIFAELCSKIREACAQIWNNAHASEPPLFHAGQLLNAASVEPELPSDDTTVVSDCIADYLQAAAVIENLTHDIKEGHGPDPEDLEGSLYINTPALQTASAIVMGVRGRLQKIFDTPPVHIIRSMREWRLWEDHIKTAGLPDAPDIHALYKGVLMKPERLVHLDPRYATPTEFYSMAKDIRDHGAMFKALKAVPGQDEVLEGLTAGRIVIVRDDPQEDTPNAPRDLLGFYNVVSDPDAVKEHMSSDLLFSLDSRYESISDLPRFSRIPGPNGETRTIAYRDEDGALRIFQAAANGTLAWSVDHAVKMDMPDKGKLQRYAQLGTALKLNSYGHLQEKDGKQWVLMKIATVLGADASAAAGAHGIPPVNLSEWTIRGACPWKAGSSGMVVLPRPIVNVGSMTLNTKLGAHEVFTITEEFTREGVKMRILWCYLAQQLPPDIP